MNEADQVVQEKFLNAMAENYLLQDAILDASELAVISTKPDGTIASINRAGEQMLGYSFEEVVGKEKLTIFHDAIELNIRAGELSHELSVSIRPGMEAIVAKVRKLKGAERKEWIYVRKDGAHFPVILSISTIWSEKEEIVGFLGIATDITEQKKTELARNESERKFKLLAENIQGTIYLCRNDETFSMMYLNDQVTSLTGYSAEEFTSGKIDFVQLYHPDDKPAIFRDVDQAIRQRESFHLQYRIRHRSGEWRWLDEVGIGIYQDDKLLMLEGYISDVTERKTAEVELNLSKNRLETASRELQEQNRQLSEFAHIISHNLRSPVGNIGALVSLLNGDSTIDEYRTIFGKLKTASGNLQETLNDLMQILIIKEESQTEKAQLNFDEVFTKVKQDLAGEIIKCGATVTGDFSACSEIHYSKTYLESIFLNLLSNSIKYKSARRSLKVHFETSVENGKTIMRVRDNALGIDLKRYGSELFVLRKTFHEHKDARGVGLFLTKTQIESMGGKITVESEVDRGSVFTIRFN